MNLSTLTVREETIAKKIVDVAYTVQKNLGPGLVEKVYEVCFCYELTKRYLKYLRQIDLPIIYDGITFNEGLKLGCFRRKLYHLRIKGCGWSESCLETPTTQPLETHQEPSGFPYKLQCSFN